MPVKVFINIETKFRINNGVSFVTGLSAVKIVKVVVPEIIQYGVQDAVILDCDYTYGNNTSGLVVKWFFKNKARPVYQWIVTQKPQDMGILRGRVDLTYRASNDPLKMHRALRIVKPNTDISGDYTCVVSTFMEEDSRTKQMIVFGEWLFYCSPIFCVLVLRIIDTGVVKCESLGDLFDVAGGYCF